MDKAALDAKVLDRNASYGGALDGSVPAGVYNLKVVNDAGADMANASINIGGRMFQADANARLRILDPQYINEEIEYHEQIQAYELKIVKAILVSNVMAKMILGQGGFDLLPKGKSVTGMAEELKQTEATPDAIAFYDPTSAIYARAIAKIKMIVHATGVVLNEEGSSLRSASSNMAKAVTSSHDAGK